MKLRHAVAFTMLALAAGACRKKPVVSPNPGTSPADSAVTAQQERQRADSIAMAERMRAERERAERERVERDRAARENATSGLRAALTERVYFDYDSDELTQAAEDLLQRKAAILRANPSVRLRIEGHADERGSTEYNLALGQRRAEAVRAYFGGYGIDGGRFTTVSYGKERPLVEGNDEDAWSRNRRAEFGIVSGELSVPVEGVR
ncbi:MAG TPA: peptidoglycan-associated lipoprotein Pal [Longimicrobiaceae bacterium]|nr:peptidoglycan-associated lipoprotein Pal [Longimicrobiaceae bacterium]